MSYTTKTPKYQNKFESSTTTKTSTNSKNSTSSKTNQLAESIKTNSYSIEMSQTTTNHHIIDNKNKNKKTSLKNLYNKSNQLETKENFKQEMLKKDRYPHIQAYENKISEQDDQIRYLQEENRELRSLINDLKLNAECQFCKAKCIIDNNQSKLDRLEDSFKLKKSNSFKLRPITSASILCECDLDEDSYELFLDNLLQQLISAIKLNDICKLETNNTNNNNNNANLKSIITNESNITNYKPTNNYSICKSCKKIKLIESKTANQIESVNLLLSLNNNNNNTNNNSSTYKFETNQAVIKFQNMLIKQKEQQLNILNELSKMLNEFKKTESNKENNEITINNNNNSNKSKNSSSLVSLTSSSFSRFNYSKVFHSLSSIEIKHIESITNTSSTSTSSTNTSTRSSTSTSTSTNHALLYSTSNINNNKSTEDTLNLNSFIINDAVFNCMSSQSDSVSLNQSFNNLFTIEMKSSTITSSDATCKPSVQPFSSISKIPKLNKNHKFSHSAQETINFSNLTKQTRIPIRVVHEKITIKSQQIKQKQTQSSQSKLNKKYNENTKSLNYSLQKNNKLNKKTVSINKNSKPSNIKFKKIVNKRPVKQQQTKTYISNSKKLIRSETFDKKSHTDSIQITTSSSKTTIKNNESLLVIDDENVNKKTTIQINENFANKKPKRYCFPTHKSLSVYYNDRLNKRHNFKLSSNNNINGFLPIKYLSDTDVSSLADRLSSYDKDLFYNVYHLDTLYNNIDHILFTSYASDTELVYSNCSKNSNKNMNESNSNYKLFINDYFNHKYDHDDDDDHDKEDTISDNSSESNEYLLTNHIKSDDLIQIETDSDNKLVEFSLNDFNFDLDNKENIFKNYEMDNSMDDDEYDNDDVDINYKRYDEEEYEDYADKFNTDDCIDNYYLNDDLLFDDEILKISILNDLSNTLDIKQIKLELNYNTTNINNNNDNINIVRNDAYDKNKLFLDYVNSPTYSLSSLTSDSNYSLPKSITDSVSLRSSPVPYQKKCNIVSRSGKTSKSIRTKSKSFTSQGLNLIERKELAISTPIFSESKLIFSLGRKSNSIIPLMRSFYFDNYKEIDNKRKNGVFTLCSKTYNVLPINKYNNHNNYHDDDDDDDESKLNNFNTDFYKLCSESYLNGSDFNFNSSASIVSFSNYYQKKLVSDCCNINNINNANANLNNYTTSSNNKSTKQYSTDKSIQNSLTFPIKRIQCFEYNNE